MKILIQNYSSAISTEPMYLDACFNKTSLIQSRLWSNEMSAFDVMDMFKPDYVLCHYKFMNNDLVKYLSGNPNHQLVLNITGCDQKMLDSLNDILDSMKIKTSLFINNFPDEITTIKSKSIKIANLLPAADLFLSANSDIDFNLEAGIISTSNKELVEEIAAKYKTYHKIKFANEVQNDDFDLSASVASLVNIYNKYDNFIIADEAHFIFSQLFFDSMLRAKKVILSPPKNQEELVDKIIASLFSYEDNQDISQVVKNQIIRKHTCYNRAARLARLLNNEIASIELTKMADSI